MNWAVVPLRSLYRRVEESGRPDLPLLSVYRDLGVVLREGRVDNHNRASDDLSKYKVVRRGDLALNKMKTWQGSLGVSEFDGVVSPAYFVGRRVADVHDRFMHHLLRSGPMIAEYAARSKGIRPGQWDLAWDEFAAIKVQLPTAREQRAIADYLDTETARIDALIVKKRSLLELLDERVNGMVSSTIGDSGLADPTRPALEIRKLLSKIRRPGAEGLVVTAFRDGQVIARAYRRAEGYTEAWTDNTAFQGVRRGDVVVHGLDGFAGAVGTSEADGICSPVYHVMQPRDGGDPDFYGRLLHVLATTGYLGLFAVSTRERAVDFRNWDLFGRIPIPVVSVEAQREVGDRIRSIRPLRAAIKRSEALAVERRQTLIAAVVTGELEIPGVAS